MKDIPPVPDSDVAQHATTPARHDDSSDTERPHGFQEPPIESRIGPYRLLDELGRGGMGVVYLAEQTEPVRRRVALKLIKVGMDTREVLARFHAERQAMAMMDHPNVARVLDGGATDDGRPYFVMDFVDGLPITDYCNRYKLGNAERLQLFIHVCQAIQHAHQKGIIHRDVKPSNVLVMVKDREAIPKVIDFGIAKATDQRLTEKTFFTERGQMIGTPAYMSPEQIDSTGLNVDTRSDVYSLGVLLYELLTGTLPFDVKEMREKGFSEIQRTVREVDPPRPSTRVSALGGTDRERVARRHGTTQHGITRELRGDLDAITMKAMEKDRTHRYETANALAADVHRYLAGEPVVATPPSTAYRIRKFVRRNRTVVTAVAATFVAAVVLTAASFLVLTRKVSDSVAERVQAEQAKQNSEESRDLVKRGATLMLGEDPVSLVLGSPDPAIVIDMATRQITASNAAFRKLFGYPEDEVRGMSVMRLTAEPEKTREAFQAIAEGKLETVERQLLRADGSEFTAEIVAGKFTEDGKNYAIGVFRPVPEAGSAASPPTR